MRPLLSLLVLIPALGQARAITAGADGAFALLSGPGQTRPGGAAGGFAYVGLGESWMVGGAAHYGLLGGPTHAFSAAASVLWRLDVVHWVPFATFDAGVLVHALPDRARGAELDLAFGVGVDRLLSRELAVGAHVRYHLVATDVSAFPAYVTAAFRVRLSWD